MTDTQERMRALLDQRAQQTSRRTRQDGDSGRVTSLVLRRWAGPKRNGSMRGRRKGQ
ncbi:hypothetical protein [Streptomyces sp. N50]|uniref:hypothetical protein n=1 Tax=Streptomyces sp. N50 TaxID=3081765 RepID=UPI002961E964|nr:hypothetical protein [Streptomyces sp. N50]WOX09170.1 hypothetical protein R2B38_09850 [Streptomyces sp. N50]